MVDPQQNRLVRIGSLTSVLLQASELIQQYYESGEDDPTFSVEKDHLKFTASRDVPDASAKLETKFGCSPSRGLEKADLAKRNLLKGITANESTIVHVLNIFVPTYRLHLPRMFVPAARREIYLTILCCQSRMDFTVPHDLKLNLWTHFSFTESMLSLDNAGYCFIRPTGCAA